MPYLQSALKEVLRMHPATGLPLWRVVSAGELQYQEHWLPPGINVGLDSWVAHYNKRVYGDDTHLFLPEQWEEAKAENVERYKEMEANYVLVSRMARLVCVRTNSTTSSALGPERV